MPTDPQVSGLPRGVCQFALVQLVSAVAGACCVAGPGGTTPAAEGRGSQQNRALDAIVATSAKTRGFRLLGVVPEDVGSSGPPWRLSAVKGSSAPRRSPDESSR